MKAYLNIIAICSVLLSCSTENKPVYLLKTTVEPAGAGSVTPDQGEYEKGNTITITATPNEHWAFIGWTGDYTGTSSTVTIKMDSDKDISALFQKREYPLAIEIEGEGSVSEQVLQPKSTDYEGGATVELTATASEGWQFSHWEGHLEGNTNPATIIVDSEKNVKAVFVRSDYPLTIAVVGNGTVTEAVVHSKSTDYPYQTVVELTAIPEDGWVFSEWQGDITGNENPVQIEVTKESEVTAVFVKQYYDVSIDLEGSGTIFINLILGNQSEDKFEYKSNVYIEVEPASGWTFLEWEGDLVGSPNPVSVNVEGDISATAILQEAPFEGNGTVQSPFQIKTLEQLQIIREPRFLDKHFIQMNDIDASATASWNDGKGFIPIGFQDTQKFTGTYDGGGFQINNLKIDLDIQFNATEFAVGLFGFVDHGYIKNVTLEDVDITGTQGVGGLAGFVGPDSRVENVQVTGSVNGTKHTGGLIGFLQSSEINVVTANVTVKGDSQVGGLVGSSFDSQVTSARAYGKVNGTQSVGGLIGYQDQSRMVINSYARGNVSGLTNVGGLIGASFNTAQMIRYVHATGDVIGEQNTGGLIGIYNGLGVLTDTYATGDVSSNNGTYIGGLVGRMTAGKIYKSYALGDVSGGTGIGGMVGRNDADGMLIESYSAGKVSGSTGYGALIGQNQGVINSSYWDKNTSGQNGPVWDPYQGTTDAIGLTTSQMTGSNAINNMTKFDWNTTWKTTNGYPTLKL